MFLFLSFREWIRGFYNLLKENPPSLFILLQWTSISIASLWASHCSCIYWPRWWWCCWAGSDESSQCCVLMAFSFIKRECSSISVTSLMSQSLCLTSHFPYRVAQGHLCSQFPFPPVKNIEVLKWAIFLTIHTGPDQILSLPSHPLKIWVTDHLPFSQFRVPPVMIALLYFLFITAT
jgi:hypothetical protein